MDVEMRAAQQSEGEGPSPSLESAKSHDSAIHADDDADGLEERRHTKVGCLPLSHFSRAFCTDMDLGRMPLMQSEHDAFAKSEHASALSDVAKGYLVWHRSVLSIVAPLLVVTSAVLIYMTIVTYNNADVWLEKYFGERPWALLRDAKSALMSVYHVSLSVALVEMGSAVAAAALSFGALASWMSLRRASRLITTALLLLAVLPVLLALCVPTAMFVDVEAVQQALCVSQLVRAFETVKRRQEGRPSFQPTPAVDDWTPIISSLCEASLEQLNTVGQIDQSALASTLGEFGLLDNLPPALFNSSNVDPVCEAEAPTGAPLIDRRILRACLSIAFLTSSSSQLASTTAFGIVVTLIISQVSHVLTTLLPVSASLAMGMVQSALYTKQLLAHTRLPAWHATIIVTAGLPSLVALLALISQVPLMSLGRAMSP